MSLQTYADLNAKIGEPVELPLTFEQIVKLRRRTIYSLVTFLLRQLDAERAQRSAIKLFKFTHPLIPAPWEAKKFWQVLPPLVVSDEKEILGTTAFGLEFPNPIGIAAGFDKNAELRDAILKVGFGFVECGTITPLPQAGNPGPRLFRLEDDLAVINRMGFNNCGADAAAHSFSGRIPKGIVGINIGANKASADRISDYRIAYSKLSRFADYVTINVSSPNTPGLRALQNRSELNELLDEVISEREGGAFKRPILLKIAPDVSERDMDEIADVCLSHAIEGLIVSNTTVNRDMALRSDESSEPGGLSGPPLFKRSTEVLLGMRRRLGKRFVLIGAGGVSSGADAYRKIRAGASLVQLYTIYSYYGPDIVTQIKEDLIQLVRNDGFKNIGEAVGIDAD